jgi:hypothetical protein
MGSVVNGAIQKIHGYDWEKGEQDTLAWVSPYGYGLIPMKIAFLEG